MFFSPGFRTGSAPRTDLIWSHTFDSFDEWAINEPEESPFIQNGASRLQRRGFYLRHFQACVQQSLAAGYSLFIDTRMTIQEREAVGRQLFRARRRGAGRLVLRFRLFVYFETIDVLSFFPNDGAESIVVLGLGRFFSL